MNALLRATHNLQTIDTIKQTGFVLRISGNIIESTGPNANIGEICAILRAGGAHLGYAEVIGFRRNTLILMPLHELENIGPGALVRKHGTASHAMVGEALVGRIINAMGEPIDGLGPIVADERRNISSTPPNPLQRKPVSDFFETGVRAMDGFLSMGRGQRIGIMAGSGVGKSVLLGMISRYSSADINVIALIGERGREVSEFLARDLGEDGLAKSVVIVVTSDEMPLMRRRGALLATTVAEYFRDKHKDVILLMDSLTRVAMAQREIGLAVGEPPTTKGYTPSTFSLLPKLLERAGNGIEGSITAIYTVLVENDDMDDPIGDAARGILDGHIVLSRNLASRGYFPAIDILQSVSRLMAVVTSQEHQEAAQKIRDLIATYNQAEDLINIGAYVEGSNPKIDSARKYIDEIKVILQQGTHEKTRYEDLLKVIGYFKNASSQPKPQQHNQN